ncbi:TPA: type II toxin-antitoxin system RelE/ParE family toxin [archaeon]|nr:type II toxin-antitoxin system RelE/ParE family toxin [Candidatus Naiadarchaeales archaeon SRR2090153.bin461]HIK02459.1 type II toxin-antitoxin system RelE/ParE family toxin [Candidatus Naiadarchaeales archaeon SRR2090159.bin1288]
MSFAVKFEPKALKNIERLPKEMQTRVFDKFVEVSKEPFRYLERFSHPTYYKLRIGDYRALIEVDFENKILDVKIFEHRGSIY